MTPTTITVQKDTEKWEIARDQATPVRGGELKIGSGVTVKYRMTTASKLKTLRSDDRRSGNTKEGDVGSPSFVFGVSFLGSLLRVALATPVAPG